LNRRDFARLGAAALLSHLVFDASGESFDYPWKLGIITDQVAFDLAGVLNAFYSKYQLGWAEIRYLKLGDVNRYVYTEATQRELKEIRRRLDGAGVKLSILDTAIYKITAPGTTPLGETPAYVDSSHERFDRQMEDLKRAADAAHALGTDRLRIFNFQARSEPRYHIRPRRRRTRKGDCHRQAARCNVTR
jgi:hypothetical protein